MDPMAKRVMQAFADESFNCRAAGGWVRDQLLNKVSQDIDLATDATPEQIQQVARKQRWKSVPTGIDHGTVTIVFGGRHFEVTSLREDVSTDGRHAIVSFGTSFRADAERRDFTVNALYCDLHGQLYDYVGGLRDLATRTLRFVGDPEQRIREDYLRGLRFFRFLAQLDFMPDTNSLDAIAANTEGFPKLSRERITQELKKLLSAKHPDQALKLLQGAGLWPLTMLAPAPERALPKFNDDNLSATLWLARLAYLLSLSSSKIVTAKFIASWRLAKKEGELLQYFFNFITQPPTAADAALVDLAQMEKTWVGGQSLADDLLAICRWHPQAPPFASWLQQYGDRRHASMPIDGNWLQENLQLAPGPHLKTMLTVLKYSYLKGEWTRPEEALIILRQKGAL